jgi:hypothetical protein
MRFAASLILICLPTLFPDALPAEQILEGYTVVNGNGYAFEVKAPRGWVLDNQAARDQGLNVVFYPKDSAWENGSAVCYVRVRTLSNSIHKIQDQVDDTIRDFHSQGSPHVEAKYIRTLTTQDASKARIYYFAGDKFGNFEATAYFQGRNTIHFITLSARDRTSFETSLPAFDALVTSYEDLTHPPTLDRNAPDDRKWGN